MGEDRRGELGRWEEPRRCLTFSHTFQARSAQGTLSFKASRVSVPSCPGRRAQASSPPSSPSPHVNRSPSSR